MSYREVAEWEVLDMLRRIGCGEDKSAVPRTTGHDWRRSSATWLRP